MEHLKLVDEKLYFMIIEFYKAEGKEDVCNKWIDGGNSYEMDLDNGLTYDNRYKKQISK
ncbi:hypothetical protein [Sporanaerobacter acetigenes]|nr:hypothetical protein [Sporanaerobacter acetigenes]